MTVDRLETIERALAALMRGELDDTLRAAAAAGAGQLAAAGRTSGHVQLAQVAGEIQAALASTNSLDEAVIYRLTVQAEKLRTEIDTASRPTESTGALEPAPVQVVVVDDDPMMLALLS